MSSKPVDIAPVERREALAEQIVRQLAGLIKSGDLKPGDRLPAERTLANEFGVGRPTLREALRALQLLGLLDIRHGGGVFVAEWQPDTLFGPLHLFVSLQPHDLGTILAARKVIEGAVIAFVASKVSDAHIDRLETNLVALEALIAAGQSDESRDEFNRLAQQFRDIISEAADNPILVRAIMSLDLLSAAARNRMTGRGTLEQLLENHRRMVQALIAHDPVAAREALEAHIDYLAKANSVDAPGVSRA